MTVNCKTDMSQVFWCWWAAMTCMAKRNTCFVADPSLNSYLATVPMDFDTSFCP